MTQSDSEPDGIDQSISDTVRTTAMIAGYVAQNTATALEQHARQQARDAVDRSRDLRARYDAERRAALAQMAPARTPQWWRAADLPDMVQAWQTARAWSGGDAHAKAVEDRAVREVKSRYGVDLRGVSDAATVLAAAHRLDAQVHQAGRPDRTSGTNGSSPVPRRIDDGHETPGAARLAPTAGPRTAAVDTEAQAARTVADANQAFPPSAALTVPADLDRAGAAVVPVPRQRPPQARDR